jgi:autoinducer 2-degrading protein
MPKVSIIVEFKLHKGKQEEFEKHIRAHAALSLKEPGCIRFDVMRPFEKDGTPIIDCIWLAELYENQDAVNFHESSPRMPQLGEKTAPLVESRRLVYGSVVDPE